jgi:hypothetical protein
MSTVLELTTPQISSNPLGIPSTDETYHLGALPEDLYSRICPFLDALSVCNVSVKFTHIP